MTGARPGAATVAGHLATLATGHVLLAALVLAAVPQHAASAARLLAGSVTATAGGLLLLAAGPLLRREPVRGPLDRPSPAPPPPVAPPALAAARLDLRSPRPPARGAAIAAPVAPVGPEVQRRLRGAAELTLSRRGLALDDPVARSLLPADAWAALTGRPATGADATRAAAAVHCVLDALAALEPAPGGAP